MQCFASLRSGAQPYRYELCHFATKGTQIILVVHAHRLAVVEIKNSLFLHENTKTTIE